MTIQDIPSIGVIRQRIGQHLSAASKAAQKLDDNEMREQIAQAAATLRRAFIDGPTAVASSIIQQNETEL